MANNTEKRTQKEMYEAIINILLEHENTDEEVDFCEKKIEQIEKKAAKAKATAQEKKEEVDELCEVVLEVLTDDFCIIPEIAAKIEGPDVTPQKISSKLTKLAKMGLAERSEVKVAGGEGQKSRKLVAFKKTQIDITE